MVTNGNDTLIGTEGDDTLIGLGGDDILRGLAGNDRLEGGSGNDHLEGNGTLLGGDGNDVLEGGAGINDLQGGDGDDTLSSMEYWGSASGTLRGGAGNDLISGYGQLWGDDGDDLIQTGGNTVVDAGDGNDRVTYSATFGSGASVDGGTGYDVIDLYFPSPFIDYSDPDFTVRFPDFDMHKVVNFEEIKLTTYPSYPFFWPISIFDENVGAANVLKIGASGAWPGSWPGLNVDASAVTTGQLLIEGGSNSDHITGGQLGDTVNGSDGYDVLDGRGGDDILNGGSWRRHADWRRWQR
jgi:Ca2+-binding RTX toxin-like protein